jgi:hypothetical protein
MPSASVGAPGSRTRVAVTLAVLAKLVSVTASPVSGSRLPPLLTISGPADRPIAGAVTTSMTTGVGSVIVPAG